MTSSKRRQQRAWEALRAFSVGLEPPKQSWRWPHSRSSREVYTVLATILLGFLALAYVLYFVKQVLGR